MRFQNETDVVACKGVAIYSCLPVFFPVLAEASQSVGDRSSLVTDSHPLFSSDETLRSDADVQIIDRRHHVSMGEPNAWHSEANLTIT